MLFFTTLFSCKKSELNNKIKLSNDAINKSEIIHWPTEMQVEYANFHLKKLGIIFNKLWKQEAFKSKIYQRLNKKTEKGFEAEILFKDIIMILKESKDINYNENDMEVLQKGIEAFQGILKYESLDPQLYFPNYSRNYYLKGIPRNANRANDPTYLLSTDPDEPEAVPYYKIENDEFVQQPGLMDEQLALQEDELIVLGLNEFNPDEYPDYHPLIVSDTTGIIDSLPQQNNMTNIVGDLEIIKMQISKHKESFYKGASKIHFRAKGLTGFRDNMYSEYVRVNGMCGGPVSLENVQQFVDVKGSSQHPSGHFYGSWSRQEVENATIKRIHATLEEDFFYIPSYNYIYHIPWNYPNYYSNQNSRGTRIESIQVVVFEYDTWPCGVKSNNLFYPLLAIGGQGGLTPEEIKFRSAHSEYAFYVVFNFPYTQCNEISPRFYNTFDTDEVIETPPYDHRDGLPHITHHTSLRRVN